MSFKSFLSAVGHDFTAVFHWLGSPQGQAAVTAGETAAVVIGTATGGPATGVAISGVEGLINIGLKGVLNMEASAAAVGAQSGTGAQKAVAVAATLEPQVFALLQQLGIKNPTVDQVQTVANAVTNGLAGILNAIPAPVASVPQPATTTA